MLKDWIDRQATDALSRTYAEPEPANSVLRLEDIRELELSCKPPPFTVGICHPEILSRVSRFAEPAGSFTTLSPTVALHPSPTMTRRRQVRFPRSKRRRIRKKWRRRPCNWVVEPDPHVYLADFNVLAR